MKIYKIVPYFGCIALRKNEIPHNAIIRFCDVINQENQNGWEFVNTFPVTIKKKVGFCKYVNEIYNAFIFSKDDEVG